MLTTLKAIKSKEILFSRILNKNIEGRQSNNIVPNHVMTPHKPLNFLKMEPRITMMLLRGS